MSFPDAVFESADLPLPELLAARLDGELMPRAAGFVCVDHPDTRAVRAVLACGPAPPRSVLEQWTAAWVHGALPVPREDTWVAIDVAERVRYTPRAGLHVREVRLEPSSVMLAGGVRITTVLRTACDLARLATAEPLLPEVLLALCGTGELTPEDLLRSLRRGRRLPFRDRALRLVEAEFSQR